MRNVVILTYIMMKVYTKSWHKLPITKARKEVRLTNSVMIF